MARSSPNVELQIVDPKVLIIEAYIRAGGKLTMTPSEAGELLGIGKTKAYEMIDKGTLPSFDMDGRRRVSIRQLLECLSQFESTARIRP